MCEEAQWLVERADTPLAALSQNPSSADCGYFCGYALSLLHRSPGNPNRPHVSRLQVYQARENFLNTPAGSRVLNHRHNNWLMLQRAAVYLTARSTGSGVRGLGLPGAYQQRTIAGVVTAANRFQRLGEFVGGQPRFGLMFNILPPRGTQGHWVAVVGRQPRDVSRPVSQLYVYDPAGIGSTPQLLRWVSGPEFDNHYRGWPLQGVVATADARP